MPSSSLRTISFVTRYNTECKSRGGHRLWQCFCTLRINKLSLGICIYIQRMYTREGASNDELPSSKMAGPLCWTSLSRSLLLLLLLTLSFYMSILHFVPLSLSLLSVVSSRCSVLLVSLSLLASRRIPRAAKRSIENEREIICSMIVSNLPWCSRCVLIESYTDTF